jgi:hypothetical protein
LNIVIKDVERNEVFTTEKVKEAYEFLKTIIPNKHLSTQQQIQNAINYDIKNEKPMSLFGFYTSDEQKDLYRIEVTYENQ